MWDIYCNFLSLGFCHSSELNPSLLFWGKRFNDHFLTCVSAPQSEKLLLFDTVQSELEEKIRRLEEDRHSIDITSGTSTVTSCSESPLIHTIRMIRLGKVNSVVLNSLELQAFNYNTCIQYLHLNDCVIILV